MLCPGADKPRGFFLTVEGPDGSGKTTQVNLLEKSLRRARLIDSVRIKREWNKLNLRNLDAHAAIPEHLLLRDQSLLIWLIDRTTEQHSPE